MQIYVDSFTPSITNLGPGKRIGLWVQGCSLRCRGCMSPELFHRNKSSCCNVIDVFHTIVKYSPYHDGLTISGGEPFEQAESLAELIRLVKKWTDLDIMVYSGYSIQELMRDGKDRRDLLSLLDVLVDGRFEIKDSDKKLWRGSDNQVMHLMSERAQAYKKYVNAEYYGRRCLHLGITDDGKLRIVGIPSRDFLQSFKGESFEKGVELSTCV